VITSPHFTPHTSHLISSLEMKVLKTYCAINLRIIPEKKNFVYKGQ